MGPDEKKPINVLTYSKEQKTIWDNFISCSKNGVFLFYRDYMDYHSDRFKDRSLMFYRNGNLVALLPANLKDGVLYSHEGLTFGGIITDYKIKTPTVLEIFEVLVKNCKEFGINSINYKAIPYIYHSIPASEDLYALFRHNAQLTARNASSCIYLPEFKKFDSSRKHNLKKAKKGNLIVKRSFDFEPFMKIVEDTLLERHGVKPVHTLQEIKLLASRFPENIKLFASYKDEVMLAGALIYESKNVAHVQYSANSKEGRNLGAQDIIDDYLINDFYKEKKYYDFGISTEEHGRILNSGLILRKEEFGASSVIYDFYEIKL